MRLARVLFAAALCAAAAALPLRAQTPADVRAQQVAALHLEHRMILAMIDSMPQQFFRDKATPAQRDFAMQLFHATMVYPFALPRVIGAARPTFAVDSTAATADKAALRSFVNATYGWAAEVLQNQADSARLAQVRLFGQPMTGWLVWDELHQHTMWTLGQVVANFRNHGMPPASFMFF